MLIRLRTLLLLFALALPLTIASAAIQRVGPTVDVEGEAFCPGPEPRNFCSDDATSGSGASDRRCNRNGSYLNVAESGSHCSSG